MYGQNRNDEQETSVNVPECSVPWELVRVAQSISPNTRSQHTIGEMLRDSDGKLGKPVQHTYHQNLNFYINHIGQFSL